MRTRLRHRAQRPPGSGRRRHPARRAARAAASSTAQACCRCAATTSALDAARARRASRRPTREAFFQLLGDARAPAASTPAAASSTATRRPSCAPSPSASAFPVVTTLMGIGAIDTTSELSLHMLGMHGTAYANYAVEDCDFLFAVGSRFDDRVAGKVKEFAPRRQDRPPRHRRVRDRQGEERRLGARRRRQARPGAAAARPARASRRTSAAGARTCSELQAAPRAQLQPRVGRASRPSTCSSS